MKRTAVSLLALAACLVAAGTSLAAVPSAQDSGLSTSAATKTARSAATREAGVQKVSIPAAAWRVSCKRTSAVVDGFNCRVVGTAGGSECSGKLIVQLSHRRIRTRNIDIGCAQIQM